MLIFKFFTDCCSICKLKNSTTLKFVNVYTTSFLEICCHLRIIHTFSLQGITLAKLLTSFLNNIFLELNDNEFYSIERYWIIVGFLE